MSNGSQITQDICTSNWVYIDNVLHPLGTLSVFLLLRHWVAVPLNFLPNVLTKVEEAAFDIYSGKYVADTVERSLLEVKQHIRWSMSIHTVPDLCEKTIVRLF